MKMNNRGSEKQAEKEHAVHINRIRKYTARAYMKMMGS